MNPDDLARILDELGQRLGPTGEYVFALAVRQVYIYAAIGLVLAVLLFAVAAWLWRREYTGSLRDSDRSIARLAAAGLVAMGLCFTLLLCADVLNPEYAAIRGLIGAIR